MTRMTLRELAGFIDVSPATISRVINGKDNVAPATRRRVLEALKELTGLPSAFPTLIGVIVPDASNPYFSRLCFEFERELSRRGAHALVASSEGKSDRELGLLASLQAAKAKGLIYVSAGSSGEILRHTDIPIITFDRRLAGEKRDFVAVDSREGTRRAVDYLLALGHSKIGYLKGLEGTATAHQRFESFCDAMNANELNLVDDWIMPGDYTLAAGRACAERLLAFSKDRPTAMMCANDLMAIGLGQRLQQASWKLPEMLSLVGFDDIEWAEWTHPALTTIAQPIPLMVREACDLLEQRLEHIRGSRDNGEESPREVVIRPKLRVRDSVSTPWSSEKPLRLV